MTAKFKPGQLKAFIVMGDRDTEDTKDATRDTDHMWDLIEFKKAYEACGIEVETDKHEGGHEMPIQKHATARGLFNRMYEFLIKDWSKDGYAGDHWSDAVEIE